MTGEEWIVQKTGAYLPGAYEEVVETVDAYVLTDKVKSLGFPTLSLNKLIIVPMNLSSIKYVNFANLQFIKFSN